MKKTATIILNRNLPKETDTLAEHLKKNDGEIESTITLRAEELIHRKDVTLKALSANTVEEVITNLKPYGFGSEIEKAYLAYKDTNEIGIIEIIIIK